MAHVARVKAWLKARGRRWAAGAIACLLLAGCGGGDGGDAASPTPPPGPADARAILDGAAARFETLPSFRFVYDFAGDRQPIVLNLEMERAEGRIQQPDRLAAAVSARVPRLGNLKVEVDFVGVGDESWITNPFDRSAWITLEGNPIADVLDPAAGIAAVMRTVADPQVTGEERIGGADTWRIEGTFDSGELEAFVETAEAGHTVRGVIWIGRAEPLIHRIHLRGRLSMEEPANILRRIDLSDFGGADAIEPPVP